MRNRATIEQLNNITQKLENLRIKFEEYDVAFTHLVTLKQIPLDIFEIFTRNLNQFKESIRFVHSKSKRLKPKIELDLIDANDHEYQDFLRVALQATHAGQGVKNTYQYVENYIKKIFPDKKEAHKETKNSIARIARKLFLGKLDVRKLDARLSADLESSLLIEDMKEIEVNYPGFTTLKEEISQIEQALKNFDAQMEAKSFDTKKMRDEIEPIRLRFAALQALVESKQIQQKMVNSLLQRAEALPEHANIVRQFSQDVYLPDFETQIRIAQEVISNMLKLRQEFQELQLPLRLKSIHEHLKKLQAATISDQEFKVFLAKFPQEKILAVLNEIRGIVMKVAPIKDLKYIFLEEHAVDNKMILASIKEVADKIMASPNQKCNEIQQLCKAIQNFCRDIQLEPEQAVAAFDEVVRDLLQTNSQTNANRVAI